MKFIKDCRLIFVGSFYIKSSYEIDIELFVEEGLDYIEDSFYLVSKRTNYPSIIPLDEVIRTSPPYGWNEAYKFGFEGVYQDCMISYLCKIKEPYIKVYQLGAR